MKNSLEGIYIPAVTAFDCRETVSEEMMAYNIEKWNQTDVAGYMCLGSNGEFRMLDDEESLRVIKTFVECRSESKGLIAGVGRESLYHTKKFIDRIQNAGLQVDYLSVLTPHYFKKAMDDRALIAYFIAVADFSRIPVLLYCAPGFANTVCISSEVLKVLAEHPNIHGIKDTSQNMMNTYMDAVGERNDFHIMSGSVNTLYGCLKRGVKGAVISAANYFPQACARLFPLWQEAGEEMFLSYYHALCGRIRQTGARNGVAGVKACMNLCGYHAGTPRKPLQPLDDGQLEELQHTLFLDDLYF